jgi:integrative and conjugative element protein (TIGR02256 family)
MTQRVILNASAHATIEAVCRGETGGLETGGILLGHQHSGGHLSVTVAGEPGPRAERTRCSFRRDVDHARALARDGYARDHSVWIGDWHTHPDGTTHPSPTDFGAYIDIVNDPNETFETFLSLIVVPAVPQPLFYAWIISKQTAQLASMWISRP